LTACWRLLLLGWMHGDYFGHTVVDKMPSEAQDSEEEHGDERKKHLVKEFVTLI
jgi:hypothetical protein